VKLDHATFNEYAKKQQQNSMLNDKEFKTDQRLFQIESKIGAMITKEELRNQLKLKASN